MAPNLESLILEGCTRMIDVHQSIGVLRRLKQLNLRDCKSLSSLPTLLRMESLEIFILSGCPNIQRFPEIDGKMKCLLELFLDGTGIEGLPSSIGHLNRLKLLDLRDCKSLRSLPTKIFGMGSLEKLILSGCSNLERFPEIDGKMECLLELYLDETGIEELPFSIGHLSGLKLLDLRDCKSLRSLPTKITGMESLEELILSGCTNLVRFPEIDGGMRCLLELYLDATGIEELPSSIGHLSNLVLLNLKDCSNLVSVPSSLCGCKCLETLNLSGCSKLETLPHNLEQVECLKQLDLSETTIRNLRSFILHFKNQKILSGFKGSSALMLPHLSSLSSLMKLDLSDCNLGEDHLLSDFCCLSSLGELDLSGNNFVSLPENLGRLPNLYRLDLLDCRKLKSLPETLTSIRDVNIDGCASLEVIEDPTTVHEKRFDVTIRGIDCYKLAEKNNALTLLKKHLKVCISLTESQFRIYCISCQRNFFFLFLQVHANARGCFSILVPGSEIPEWFNHQTDETCTEIIELYGFERVEESGITIRLPLPPIIGNDSPWVGVAFCCIFVYDFNDDGAWGPKVISHDIYIRGRYHVGTAIYLDEKHRGQQVKKDHLWLRYWTRNELYNLESNYYEPKCNEIFECTTRNLTNIKVKKCGVRLVYEKDLEKVIQIEKQCSSPASVNFDDDVTHKRNIYEAGMSEHSAEETPQPKLLKRNCTFHMGKKTLIPVDPDELSSAINN
ncbi:hypothetical protein PTKIN_Ptkin14bG0136200 [Pterospermum kingtungense]